MHDTYVRLHILWSLNQNKAMKLFPLYDFLWTIFYCIERTFLFFLHTSMQETIQRSHGFSLNILVW